MRLDLSCEDLNPGFAEKVLFGRYGNTRIVLQFYGDSGISALHHKLQVIAFRVEDMIR